MKDVGKCIRRYRMKLRDVFSSHQLALTASMSLTKFCARHIPNICKRKKINYECDVMST